MGNNIILETKFVADISGSFNIPSYQRGYRWSETEVVRLLDDIYQNGKKNYCLQPVVVRKKEDQYELIDGQQRLTTLYLIYKYMKNVNPFFNEPAFTLSYQTRDQSEEFLKTLDMTQQDDNIDFWFIAKAYNTIKEWFEQDLQIRVMHIFEYLKEDVKIIWYEVGESEDAISLFTRLNIGKIPLTSAELVKAMFLSRDNAENMRREKQEEISLQWDGIERELHNESLWFFLTNSVKGEYQTRIDLVLDLIAGKDESTREKYYTFFRFDELRKEVSLDDIWKKIYQTFLTLKGWYEDHDLYHRIGYLITSGTSLHKIFALSKDKKKSEFNESLDELIKKSVAISGNYAELSYEKSLDYKRISTLLLLFNIESVRRSDGHAQRFPFDQFKHHKGSNVTWSLEHRLIIVQTASARFATKKRSRSRLLEDTLFQKVAFMFQCVQIIAKCSQVRYLQRNQIDVGGHRTGNLLGCVSIFIDVAKDFIAVHQDFCCYDVGFIFRFGFHVVEHELMNRGGFRHIPVKLVMP